MKREFNLVFILNIIIGMFLFSNLFIVYGFSKLFLILSIVLSIYYIIVAKLYSDKKFKKIGRIDIVIVSICLVFMIFLFSFGVYYQILNSEIYSLLYYNVFLFIMHVLFTFYYLFR